VITKSIKQGDIGVRNRSFGVFGAIGITASVGIFLLLESTTEWAWYWNWLIAASVVAFIYYAYDKISSKAGVGRIPEIVLHLLALVGGFTGALLGMLVFRHKSNTRAHPLFVPIMLVGAVLWSVLIYWLSTRA
jgi:uncharacterized membrane protein YsdA (DUF1294 family)